MIPITTLEELQQCYLDWRGIEHPCKACGGSGSRAYAGTSTWRGGVGGMAITNGVCDKCWGSGDAYITWPSRRKTEAQDAKITTLTAERDKLKEEKAKLLEVLRPFALIGAAWASVPKALPLFVRDEYETVFQGGIKAGDLRAAAALIKELEGK